MTNWKVKTQEYEDRFLNKRIEVKSSTIRKYRPVIGKFGLVIRISGSSLGVQIDDMTNKGSAYGVFWFKRNEIKIVDEFDDKGDVVMTGYKNIAVVNLLEDYNKKDYYFAIYDEELNAMTGNLVVVNVRGKDKRVLGMVKEIIPVENYDKTVTAQVVAVVHEINYNNRVAEEERLQEIAKKKVAIEKELEEEIAKRKTLEFYEEMAEKYSDNPRLAELVRELKELGA